MKVRTKLLLGAIVLAGLSVSVFAACVAELNMGGKKVTNVAEPTADTDAATKAYVDRGAVEVTPPAGYGVIYMSGKAWLDRNLGATAVASSVADSVAYGDLYQWGRLADGHQRGNTGITTAPSTTDVPTEPYFISVSASPYNWRSTNRTHFWSGVGSTANGVCPAGYRVPSEQDFADLDIASMEDAFIKIKLTAASRRNTTGGLEARTGQYGFYWTSSIDGEYSRALFIYSNGSYFHSYGRAYAFSVRCLKHL